MFIQSVALKAFGSPDHGLRTLGEEITFTARPKINSQSQMFRYGQSIFCLPHWPKFSGFFDLCLHWVSVVHVPDYNKGIYSVFASFRIRKKRLNGNAVQTKSCANLSKQVQAFLDLSTLLMWGHKTKTAEAKTA